MALSINRSLVWKPSASRAKQLWSLDLKKTFESKPEKLNYVLRNDV